MANKKITDLDELTTLDDAVIVPVVDPVGPVTSYMTAANLRAGLVGATATLIPDLMALGLEFPDGLGVRAQFAGTSTTMSATPQELINLGDMNRIAVAIVTGEESGGGLSAWWVQVGQLHIGSGGTTVDDFELSASGAPFTSALAWSVNVDDELVLTVTPDAAHTVAWRAVVLHWVTA